MDGSALKMIEVKKDGSDTNLDRGNVIGTRLD